MYVMQTVLKNIARHCARSFYLLKDEFSSGANRLSELYRHVNNQNSIYSMLGMGCISGMCCSKLYPLSTVLRSLLAPSAATQSIVF